TIRPQMDLAGMGPEEARELLLAALTPDPKSGILRLSDQPCLIVRPEVIVSIQKQLEQTVGGSAKGILYLAGERSSDAGLKFLSALTSGVSLPLTLAGASLALSPGTPWQSPTLRLSKRGRKIFRHACRSCVGHGAHTRRRRRNCVLFSRALRRRHRHFLGSRLGEGPTEVRPNVDDWRNRGCRHWDIRLRGLRHTPTADSHRALARFPLRLAVRQSFERLCSRETSRSKGVCRVEAGMKDRQ